MGLKRATPALGRAGSGTPASWPLLTGARPCFILLACETIGAPLHKFGHRVFASKHPVQTQLPQDKIFGEQIRKYFFPGLSFRSEAYGSGMFHSARRPGRCRTTIPACSFSRDKCWSFATPTSLSCPGASLLQPLQHTVPRQTSPSVLHFYLSRGSWRVWLQPLPGPKHGCPLIG